MKFVALLRGINVGGNKKVPMADLKKILEKAGLTNVKTLLASGNVVFETKETNAEKLRILIESAIEKKFGFSAHTIVRSLSEIQALQKSDPFKGIPVKDSTRLYVTFLSTKPTSKLKVPAEFGDGYFKILSVSSQEVCSVLEVTEDRGTVDLMDVLEKEYGKDVTTRNWNTVCKIAAL